MAPLQMANPDGLPDRLQQLFTRQYDLPPGQPVSDFLISEPNLARALGARPSQSPEQLLLLQEEDALNLSLYLDAGLFKSPLSLNSYLTVAEGVSHFTYISYCARHDRSTSQLELELQAEVDKFFASAGRPEMSLSELHQLLFEKVRYREHLSAQERDRYAAANRMAASLCQQWISRYGDNIRHPCWQADARRFYRLPAQRKMRRARA